MIADFRGRYWFLSNYFSAPILLTGAHFGPSGIVFPTNEHAFAACKTFDLHLRQQIAAQRTPGEAKRLGRGVQLRDDWDTARLTVMARLVHEKFVQHPRLAQMLIQTGDEMLVEGNTWGDRFWGADCTSGVGENHLGQVLMQERARLVLALQHDSPLHSSAYIGVPAQQMVFG